MLTQSLNTSISSAKAAPVPFANPDQFCALTGHAGLVASEFSYHKDEEIYGEDEPAEYVYQVVSGSVRSYKLLSDGRRQIGAFYLPGDVFGLEDGGKIAGGRGQGLDPRGVWRRIEHMDLGAVLGARLGDRERACIELQRGQGGALAVPMQAPGDHEVKGEPQTVVEAEGDALTGATDFGHRAIENGLQRRIHGAKQKRPSERSFA